MNILDIPNFIFGPSSTVNMVATSNNNPPNNNPSNESQSGRSVRPRLVNGHGLVPFDTNVVFPTVLAYCASGGILVGRRVTSTLREKKQKAGNMFYFFPLALIIKVYDRHNGGSSTTYSKIPREEEQEPAETTQTSTT